MAACGAGSCGSEWRVAARVEVKRWRTRAEQGHENYAVTVDLQQIAPEVASIVLVAHDPEPGYTRPTLVIMAPKKQTADQVSARIGSPCLRHGVHGASIARGIGPHALVQRERAHAAHGCRGHATRASVVVPLSRRACAAGARCTNECPRTVSFQVLGIYESREYGSTPVVMCQMLRQPGQHSVARLESRLFRGGGGGRSPGSRRRSPTPAAHASTVDAGRRIVGQVRGWLA
jgi:hypothetical protein